MSVSLQIVRLSSEMLSSVPWHTRFPATFRRFDRDMEKLMERFFSPEEEGWMPALEFTPRANIAETEKAYEVTFDLPGINPKELTVEIRENALMVIGERKE